MLSAGYLITDWRPDLIESMLSYLEPSKMRAVLVGKKLEPICDRTEKWYGTKFNVHKIDDALLSDWTDCELNANFKLPVPNPFIPAHFNLMPAANVTVHPAIIYDTENIRVWHKQDDEFKKPKAILDFNFSSPIVYSDPQNCNLTNLFVQLLLDGMNEYLYDAELGGLNVNIVNTSYGVSVRVSGFSEKQQLVLDYVLKEMFDFNVNPERFEIFKERYIRSLSNFHADQPYKLAVYYLSVILTEFAWTKQELLESTKGRIIDLKLYVPTCTYFTSRSLFSR